MGGEVLMTFLVPVVFFHVVEVVTSIVSQLLNKARSEETGVEEHDALGEEVTG